MLILLKQSKDSGQSRLIHTKGIYNKNKDCWRRKITKNKDCRRLLKF